MAACSEVDLLLSDSCVLFFLTVPAVPTNLSLTNPGSSSELYTSWNEPPGRRDHYHVTLYSLSTQSRIQVQTLSPDALNITWTQLEAGSKFAVQVTAVKGSLKASSINVTQWTCESGWLGWAPHYEPPPYLSRAPSTTFPNPSHAHSFCDGPTFVLTALTPSWTQNQTPHPPQRLWLCPLPHPAAHPRDDTLKAMCLPGPLCPGFSPEDLWSSLPVGALGTAASTEQEG